MIMQSSRNFRGVYYSADIKQALNVQSLKSLKNDRKLGSK